MVAIRVSHGQQQAVEVVVLKVQFRQRLADVGLLELESPAHGFQVRLDVTQPPSQGLLGVGDGQFLLSSHLLHARSSSLHRLLRTIRRTLVTDC